MNGSITRLPVCPSLAGGQVARELGDTPTGEIGCLDTGNPGKIKSFGKPLENSCAHGKKMAKSVWKKNGDATVQQRIVALLFQWDTAKNLHVMCVVCNIL